VRDAPRRAVSGRGGALGGGAQRATPGRGRALRGPRLGEGRRAWRAAPARLPCDEGAASGLGRGSSGAGATRRELAADGWRRVAGVNAD